MGNVRVWIQDLWGGGGGKANNLQGILSRSTVPQTVMRERKCTLLHQLRWIPHHADTLRLWREIFSLPNVFSRTQPRHSGLTQGRFLPGVLHSYRLKRRSKHNAKRTRHCGVHLALCTHVAEKLRPHSQINPQSTLWSREWFQTPVLATGAVGARGSGLSRSRPLWAHCTHTQLQSSLHRLWGMGKHFCLWAQQFLWALIHTLNEIIYWTIKLCLSLGSKSSSVTLSAKSLKPEISSLALFQVFRFISDIKGLQIKDLRFLMYLYYPVWSSFLTTLDLLLT